MCPRDFEPYEKAYILKFEEDDRKSWMNGAYFYEALIVILNNAFKSRGSKTYEYPKEPYSSKNQTREMTREEVYALPDDEREKVLMQAIESAMAGTIDSFNRKKESEEE